MSGMLQATVYFLHINAGEMLKHCMETEIQMYAKKIVCRMQIYALRSCNLNPQHNNADKFLLK